jgi:radical SAM superfamily enzyme YgiQ (UPF0313 family)
LRYEGIVYRPPSEAGSLIIQATLSCPHNRCAFCAMYKDRKFRKRPLEEVIEDLDMALSIYGPHAIHTIFLADGNSAVLPTQKLEAIGEAARQRFPGLERITVYGSAKFLVKKSEEEWRRVADASPRPASRAFTPASSRATPSPSSRSARGSLQGRRSRPTATSRLPESSSRST